jgi:hypothetical protein
MRGSLREIVTIAPVVTIGEDGTPSGKKRKSFPNFDCYPVASALAYSPEPMGIGPEPIPFVVRGSADLSRRGIGWYSQHDADSPA